MYGGDDDPCPFDDANHGVSATRRRSYRGGDGQYVEYNSDEYRDQFSKDEDDRDLAAICTLSPPARVRVRRALTRGRSVWDRGQTSFVPTSCMLGPGVHASVRV